MFGQKREKTDLIAYIREGREMTQREKLRLIISLSIPSILAQISATVMFFIDASMVGHLGANASAAIGLVETTGWLMGGLASAANMGFSVQVAHAIGANDFKRARRILRQSMVCCLLFSLTISIISILISHPLPYWLGGSEEIAHDATVYFAIIGFCGIFFQMEGLAGSMLKCSGNMKIPSALNILMCTLDVIFNYLFIYIIDMGVTGAAVGTGLAELITAGLMLYFLLCRSDILRLKGRPGHSFHPQSDVVRNAFKIGAPMGLQHMLMGGAQIVSTIIVAPLGTIAIAAHSLAITVESLCYMPGYGIADAATTLVGQSFGAGKRQLTRSFARMSISLGMLVMTLMGILMWIFASELMSLLTPIDEIIQVGAFSLRIEAFAEPMFAAAIVCYGVFVGVGDTLKPAMMNLGCMWAVRLTLAAWLAPIYGLPGVWMAMAIELTFRGLSFLIRLFYGNWLKQLKEDHHTKPKMKIVVSQDIKQVCPEFVGACVEAQVVNTSYDSELWKDIETLCNKFREELTTESLKEITSIAATRRVYKACGKDPSRYRPASEALIRRVLQGKELYQLNTLVDLVNLASIAFGYSIGGFDADHFEGDTLTLGIGREGEPYEGIGRGTINIQGLPVYRDAIGGVGTPTSDHERTKISEQTTHLVVLINGYDGNEQRIKENAEYIQDLLRKHCKSDGGNYYIYK